jgi:hypothetical protein
MSDVGVPSFIKIDVEGYESSVLLGLTQPVGCISIEFAAENIENAFRCIDYADSRWAMLFQFSAEESAAFQFPGWVTAAEIRNALLGLIATDKLAWGDIYMKCADRTPVAAASGAVK